MKPTLPADCITQWTLPVETRQGRFTAMFSSRGLTRLLFPSTRNEANGHFARSIPSSVRNWHRITQRAIRAALAGSRPGRLPPLDWSRATRFQSSVWKELLTVAPGHTTTYGALARRIGEPNAARAVGAACGANPMPVLVPCHRVLAASGGLGGFSAGLKWKRHLLAAEQPSARSAFRHPTVCLR